MTYAHVPQYAKMLDGKLKDIHAKRIALAKLEGELKAALGTVQLST